MPGRPRVPAELRALVRERAGGLCEYCHASEAWQYVEFTMEHLIPVVAGGETSAENLALCCFSCNRRKWDRRTAVDPEGGGEQRLFNPRTEPWNDHFAWSADALEVVGLTATGRATVAALELNRERSRRVRAADVAVGRHPPSGDRRLG